MEENELTSGSTLEDILTTEGQQPTPDEETDAKEGISESTDPPVPGVVEEKEEEEEDTPDLSLDPDLEKHPVLKAKWEAYKAQKEKGIQKWMNEQQTQAKELTEFKQQYEPLVEFYHQFQDPSTAPQAFAQLKAALETTYGPDFGASKPQDEDALWEQESVAQTKQRWKTEFLSEAERIIRSVVSEIKGELEPVKQHFTSQTESQKLASAAEEVLPRIKQQHETSDDQWVTKELVIEALKEFPGLDPVKAFRAHHVDKIARKVAEYARSQKVRNLPSNTSGGTTRAELRPGAAFADILAAEATL